jgi:hypothetical protein
VRRMVARLQEVGDKAVIHGLKGNRSNRRMEEEVRKRTVEILSEERRHDFGPTYARRRWRRPTGIWKPTICRGGRKT